MGREVRRVPADWEHPKDAKGQHIPMYEHFPYNAEEVREGLRDGWLKGEKKPYGLAVMPQWPKAKRTHYQMYEDTTEGTPISPVMASPEELARWLADNGASAFAGHTATHEEWLAMIGFGSAPTFGGVVGGEIESGVALVAKSAVPTANDLARAICDRLLRERRIGRDVPPPGTLNDLLRDYERAVIRETP